MEWTPALQPFYYQRFGGGVERGVGTSLISCHSRPYIFQLIQTGKGEAIRIRSILRSLVPTEDLVGIISIPLKLPSLNKGKGSDCRLKRQSPRSHWLGAGLCPQHNGPRALTRKAGTQGKCLALFL